MRTGLPRTTYLYFLAQSVNLTTAVMSVTMAALVGAALAPSAAWATIPYGCQFLCLLLATYPVSRLMAAVGRRQAFLLGALPLAVAGLTGYWAVADGQFVLLVISHSALGVYIAFANFNRFATTDGLPAALVPRVLSLVVAGGVLAAVAGPLLIDVLRGVAGFAPFALCLPDDRPRAASVTQARMAEGRRRMTPAVVVAMGVAALGYGVMNLLMVQASMHMEHLHHDFADIRLAIQWHVLAMFALSFCTGAIIRCLGIKTTVCLGLVLLMGCAVVNLGGDRYGLMVTAMVMLGLGWNNLTYVGGGALLTQSLQDRATAIRLQGTNDLVIAFSATLGAFAPSLLFSSLGWAGTNLLCLALCALASVGVLAALEGRRPPRFAPVPARK